MSNTGKKCLVCQRDDKEVPLLKFEYRGNDIYVCSQHIPVLIHSPQKLQGLLPDLPGDAAPPHVH